MAKPMAIGMAIIATINPALMSRSTIRGQFLRFKSS